MTASQLVVARLVFCSRPNPSKASLVAQRRKTLLVAEVIVSNGGWRM